MFTLDWKEYASLARQAAAEGCVLLKNDRGALPIGVDETVAVFGRIQLDYYRGGTGSGGMINTPYTVSILDGLKAQRSVCPALEEAYRAWATQHPFDKGTGWAGEPWSQPEMPATDELISLADGCDAAIVIIGRTAGEDRDNVPSPGGYYLTALEEELIARVRARFERTIVVLNTANLIDLGFIEKYDPAAVLVAWTGGCEGGNGVADVLTGRVSPSGRLADTAPRALSDCPCAENFGGDKRNVYAEDIYVGYRYFETFAKNAALYPFAYGLSYTQFDVICDNVSFDGLQGALEARISNAGSYSGKYAATVFIEPPQGKLGKPARQLAAFVKTRELAPGEEETLHISFDLARVASFDDSGETGERDCFVLEAGEYRVYLGGDVRGAQCVYAHELNETTVTQRLSDALAPVEPFSRMKPEARDGGYAAVYEEVPLSMGHKLERPEDNAAFTGDVGISFIDVAAGKASLEAFIAQLPDAELAALTCGEGMCPERATPGIAGAFGGVTERLRALGVPVCGCADGPSGIRMDCGAMAFCIPSGALLACTFNAPLVESLYSMLGLELVSNGIDALLGPGLNIHRSPLCGRNFEYFSEDPLLTGLMAAAALRGLSIAGAQGTVKHFVCNDQEHMRTEVNAVISARALREIYLLPFELAVKEGHARSIMTSYNPINGIWAAGNNALLTQILRREWGYEGLVMTDWWAVMNDEGALPRADNSAAMVRAQNDLYMVVPRANDNPNFHDALAALKDGRLSRNELVRSAKNILRFILASPKMADPAPRVEALHTPAMQSRTITRTEAGALTDSLALDPAAVDARAGVSTVFAFTCPHPGKFKLDIALFADGAAATAQTPVSILMTGMPIAAFALKGKEETRLSIPFEIQNSISNYLEIYCAGGGVKVIGMEMERE